MELKFGHRVIAWDNDSNEKVKGRFVRKSAFISPLPYCVLVDNEDLSYFMHAELDPEATPINGDLVEYRNIDDPGWHRHGIYIGEKTTGKHVIQEYEGGTGLYDCVRHQQKDSLHGKTATIDGKEYELKLR